MERVGVLIDKLQEQLRRKTDVQHMLVTVQMLHNELLQAQREHAATNSAISVVMPFSFGGTTLVAAEKQPEYKPVPNPMPEPEPVPQPDPEPASQPGTEPQPHPHPRPEPLPVPSPSLAAPPPFIEYPTEKKEPVKSWHTKAAEEVPTLARQDKIVFELNDAMLQKESSLNDRLKDQKSEVGGTLVETPIRDLKRAISINDRHRFIRELFRGDDTMYERSIKTINSYHIFAEAEYWIQRELKLKLGWDSNSDTVKHFDHLVKRRFS